MHGKSFYGYKNHIKENAGSKLIDEFQVTTASEHDSKVILELIDETDKGKSIQADSASDSAEIRKELRKKKTGCRIQKKGSRHVTLTIRQKVANKSKAKTRCKVEHVFVSIHNRAKGFGIRGKGILRAGTEIALQNLVYHMMRLIYLSSQLTMNGRIEKSNKFNKKNTQESKIYKEITQEEP